MGKNMGRRSLQSNESAEITGLPLMLLILVVIAGVGLAVVLGWVGKLGGGPDSVGSVAFYTYDSDKHPSSGTQIERISIEQTLSKANQPASKKFENVTGSVNKLIGMRLFDTDGGPVPDAVLEFTGALDSPVTATSDGDGYVKINKMTFLLPPQSLTGEVKVAVKKSEWTPYDTTLIVVRT